MSGKPMTAGQLRALAGVPEAYPADGPLLRSDPPESLETVKPRHREVRDLHDGKNYCAYDGEAWPCFTARVIDNSIPSGPSLLDTLRVVLSELEHATDDSRDAAVRNAIGMLRAAAVRNAIGMLRAALPDERGRQEEHRGD